jgi:1-acyl-sn-glycerol-3-phosphate acyltransferase
MAAPQTSASQLRDQPDGGSAYSAVASVGPMLRALACLLILPVGLVTASAAAVLLAWVGAPRRRIDAVISGFARFCAWLGGTRIEVHGLDHMVPGVAYVVVPNHESNWDVVVLYSALRHISLRGAFKKEVLKVPFFGRALLKTGFVVVDRRDTNADVQRLRQGMANRPQDVSVVFYAEGKRSPDGTLQPFKKGAFVTAITNGLPILPIGTAGSRRIWPPGSLRVRSGPVVVEIGSPLPVDGYTPEDRNRLCAEAHDAVEQCRARARQRLAALGFEAGGIN